MRNYNLYIKDIINAMESIEDFVKDMNFQQMRYDDKTSSAVIQKFEIIGEATKNIPDQLRREYSNIPWKRMAGMRDRLIHAYFGVDYKLVWDAIKNEIPNLKLKLQEMFNDIEK